MTTIAARHVLTPHGALSPGAIEVDGGVIGAVRTTSGPVPDRTLAPGFIDLQVNGHGDVDVSQADGQDWARLDDLLVAQGVTTWCPTLISGPEEVYAPTLERIARAAARDGARPQIAGAHLEGPYLGGLPGAHPPEHVRPIDPAWLAGLPPIVRIVTLGPELPGAVAATRALVARGVLVSAGHTLATYDEVRSLADAGAGLVTHLFNGMPSLHHREPGPVGAALVDDRLAVSLIADLVHVHPAALALAFRAKPPTGVVLVTDAVAWQSHAVGGLRIAFDGEAPRLADGTLAGSALTMDRAVRNVTTTGCIDLRGAVLAASTNPARLLGLQDRGRLEPGARADVVALGPDLEVTATWVGGQQVWG